MAVNENWYQLPPSPEMWQQVIVETLARKIPEIPKYLHSIEMSQFDPVMGDAEGMIYLMNGLAAIPIIIKGGRLAPLDIMVTSDEKFYPVTDAFLQKIYADNVIGEPAKDKGDTNVPEGPARQIKAYNTIDHVKNAAYEVKCKLRDAVTKSASLLTFFNEHRPELLAELLTAEPPAVKEAASAEEPDPDLQFLANDGGRYFFNGEEVPCKLAAEFAREVGQIDEAKAKDLMRGGNLCIDKREKTAAVVIPQDIVVRGDVDSRYSLAVVLDLNNVPYRGLLVRGDGGRNIFIGPDFYALQDNILVLERMPLRGLEEVIMASEPSMLAVNALGVIMSDGYLEGPIRIGTVTRIGTETVVTALSNHKGPVERAYYINERCKFYAIPDNLKALMKDETESFMAMPGEIYTVAANPEGRLVFKNRAYAYTNLLYKLMSSLGIGFDDSIKLANLAQEEGAVVFKVAGEPPKKSKKDDDSKDKEPKKDKPKASDDSEDAEDNEQQPNAPKDPRDDTPVSREVPAEEEENPQEQQGMTAQEVTMPLGTPMGVDFNSIEDMAKINDPQLMDAYLSGQLVDANTAGREQIMQIGDDVLEAIKSLGRLLFIIRMGQIEYVEEQDVQMALNKMADIARSLGVSASQLTPVPTTSQPVGKPQPQSPGTEG